MIYSMQEWNFLSDIIDMELQSQKICIRKSGKLP